MQMIINGENNMKKIITYIVFVLYILICNICMYLLEEKNVIIANPALVCGCRIGLSFIAGFIVQSQDIIHIFSAGRNINFVKGNLIFSCICLGLALSRIWMYTLFAKAELNLFTLSLANPIMLEYILAFCAGIYFVRTWRPNGTTEHRCENGSDV